MVEWELNCKIDILSLYGDYIICMSELPLFSVVAISSTANKYDLFARLRIGANIPSKDDGVGYNISAQSFSLHSISSPRRLTVSEGKTKGRHFQDYVLLLSQQNVCNSCTGSIFPWQFNL
jgi:hypothetical protein